jgi:hypothetical protein
MADFFFQVGEGSAAPTAELCAGAAVAAGALIAGPLEKRSDWLKSWNSRFVVLTTEQLAWFSDCTTGEGGRRVTLHSDLLVGLSEGTLTVSIKKGTPPLLLRAASEAEIVAWHAALEGLVLAIVAEGKLARIFLREANFLSHSPQHFLEHPHLGSRNLRARGTQKTWYSMDTEGGPKRSSRAEGASLLVSLLALPPPTEGWRAAEQRAYCELVRAVSATAHPFLEAALHADVMLDADRRRAAVCRRFAPAGSIKDALNGCVDPRLAYSLKYRAPAVSCAAAEPSPPRRPVAVVACVVVRVLTACVAPAGARPRGRGVASRARACGCSGGRCSRGCASCARAGCLRAACTRAT